MADKKQHLLHKPKDYLLTSADKREIDGVKTISVMTELGMPKKVFDAAQGVFGFQKDAKPEKFGIPEKPIEDAKKLSAKETKERLDGFGITLPKGKKAEDVIAMRTQVRKAEEVKVGKRIYEVTAAEVRFYVGKVDSQNEFASVQQVSVEANELYRFTTAKKVELKEIPVRYNRTFVSQAPEAGVPSGKVAYTTKIMDVKLSVSDPKKPRTLDSMEARAERDGDTLHFDIKHGGGIGRKRKNEEFELDLKTGKVKQARLNEPAGPLQTALVGGTAVPDAAHPFDTLLGNEKFFVRSGGGSTVPYGKPLPSDKKSIAAV